MFTCAVLLILSLVVSAAVRSLSHGRELNWFTIIESFQIKDKFAVSMRAVIYTTSVTCQ